MKSNRGAPPGLRRGAEVDALQDVRTELIFWSVIWSARRSDDSGARRLTGSLFCETVKDFD
jgi:hypothetical protein